MQKAFKALSLLLIAFGTLATSFSPGQSPQPPMPSPQPPQPGPLPPQPEPQPPQPAPQPQPVPQPPSEPVIIEQPKNQEVKAPARASFTVKATGNPAPTYQWSLNGTAISGATQSSYSTGPTTLANDGGSYTVTVSNGVGNPVTSDPAILTVDPS
jgi:outer membrane biosynthesis protein TonB